MGRLPERDVRAAEAREGRFGWRPSNVTIAIVFVIIFTVGPYLAFTKHIPFTGYGYTLKATFSNSANIALKSPVRIAGVDVGEVIDIGRRGNATEIEFTVAEKGRPIHDDSFAQIRPRIFLEGNYMVDLDPGSPGAAEMSSGDQIPVSRTSTSVQLDEVFTALQAPVRADLSRLLESFGTGLMHEPTAAEDRSHPPEVHGKTGAESLNKAFFYGGDAGRYSAQVTNAFLGVEPGDLRRFVAGSGRAFGALAHSEADLQGLIVNFNIFMDAFASQSQNLTTSIARFAPALRETRKSLVSLNKALPPLRGYALALEPSVAELPGLIAAAKPWTRQAKPLFSGRELGGVARLLAQSTPGLAGAAQAGKAITIPALNRLGLCTTKIMVPTGDIVVGGQFSTGQPNYREFFYYLSNFAGIMQNFDGNGHYLRVAPNGGDTLTELRNEAGNLSTDREIFTYSPEAPIGTEPQLGGRPPKRPDVRCHNNSVPDVNGPLGQVGPPALTPVSK